MKFNIGDIVEFNHLDEATRNYKKTSGLLLDFEDNTVHSNYSVCIVLSNGKQLKVPMSKLLNSKMKIQFIELKWTTTLEQLFYTMAYLVLSQITDQ